MTETASRAPESVCRDLRYWCAERAENNAPPGSTCIGCGRRVDQIAARPDPAATARRTPRPRPESAQDAEGAGRRRDIEGLRAVAIALVVVYHLWGDGRISGGVDVFLMISAYLLTSSMIRQGRRFRYPRYLVRRFAGLLPAAATVIATTLVASLFLLPPLRWPGLVRQGMASLGYQQNWALIEMATSYTNTDRHAASPFQHFWSLSIQGQIFVVWPLLLVIGLGLHAALRLPLRAALALVFSFVAVLSFAYAQYALFHDPAAAYFDTFARIWEFALASLLATIRIPPMPRIVAFAAGWTGLIAVVAGGVVVGRMPFPGPAALWPFACAAAVVLAHQPHDRYGAGALLGTRPLVWLGGRAYGLYLWHWPILIFVLTRTRQTAATPVQGALIVVASLVLAEWTTRVVRRTTSTAHVSLFRGVATTMVWVLLVAGLAGGWTVLMNRQAEQAQAQLAQQPIPAQSPVAGPRPTPVEDETGPIAPGDTRIGQDWPETPPPCGSAMSPRPPVEDKMDCDEHVPAVAATKTVLVLGDSHSWQWLTALTPMARAENWHLISINAPGCRVSVLPTEKPGCDAHNAALRDYVLQLHPDVVFTVGTKAQPSGPEEPAAGLIEATAPWRDAGIRVVAIRDNPRWSFQVPDCVQTHSRKDPQCAAERADKLAANSPLDALAGVPGIAVMDLSDVICPQERCRPVIGGAYVYVDDNHLSRTFIGTLRGIFTDRWARAIAP